MHTDQKRTDSGRAVYGGGGIDPAVEVKVRVAPRELDLQRVWFDPVFGFAHQLVAGQIPGLGETAPYGVESAYQVLLETDLQSPASPWRNSEGKDPMADDLRRLQTAELRRN